MIGQENIFLKFYKKVSMKVSIQAFSDSLLKRHAGLVHAFSPRNYGRKDGTAGELNFGSSGDEQILSHHKKWFLEAMGIEGCDVTRVTQVHGDRVYVLNDASRSEAQVANVAADAIITSLVNRPIAVLTADCIPVVVYDPEREVAGVVHAGRKGTSLNILSKTIGMMKRVYGCHPGDLVVAMGPGIGKCCYEVDAACMEPFADNYPVWTKFAVQLPSGKYMLDLFSANMEDARKAGIGMQRISRTSYCTSCDVDRFFSYRKEGPTGRMMTVAMLRAGG